MTVDRYLKAVLTVIAVALVAIAVTPWLRLVAPAPAGAADAPYELTVPKAWGRLVGYSDGNLLLETSDGSLRAVEITGKPPEYPKTKALIKRN
ncbi:MAG: hypothetical protein AUH29_05850 [Candidatus Rokubacteria bacterium 13_1_40CM_69_27]|nr:MAG: hypothetical protein AUH29_05850 [Candidatus Rokubacteria bacterium 13_1_40CM_69_27]OLC37465.1 MAG: hypothetical protein AUH81_06105 [Candidatus Rokubacteria bacterium 13_1_40CM_4_69_5]